MNCSKKVNINLTQKQITALITAVEYSKDRFIDQENIKSAKEELLKGYCQIKDMINS